MSDKPIYFKGLSALRFIAASAVIFHHIEQYKFWKGYPSIWGQEGMVGVFIDSLGHKAVSFFFVLSGFLITYLLLAEIRKTGTVALKKFYFRRILRIWPLYYVVVLLALFVLPLITSFDHWEGLMHDSMGLVVLLHMIILPNLLRVTSIQVVGANQAWSVGVEEQFYLIWPVLVRWFHKKLPLFLVLFILIKIGAQLFFAAGGQWFDGNTAKLSDQLATLLSHMQIEQMAVGGLGAWWLFAKRENWLSVVYHPISYVLSIALFLSFFIVDYHFIGITALEGFVFLILILNISTNPLMKIGLENKLMTYMGNISYGIYMIHTLVIALLITALESWSLSDSTFNVLLYVMAPLLTFGLAALSYRYFEQFFLRFKSRFAVVKSSTNRKS